MADTQDTEDTTESEDTETPEAVEDILEALETAKTFAELAEVIGETVKEMKLGEKGGELLEIAVSELDALFKPFTSRIGGFIYGRVDKRLAFILKATKSDQISEATALALATIDHDENTLWWKNLEVALLKWQLNRSDADEAKKSPTSDFLNTFLKHTLKHTTGRASN